MARKKNSGRGRSNRFAVPLAPIIGAVPITTLMVKQLQREGIPMTDRASGAANLFIGAMTGVDIQQRSFDPRFLFAGLVPLVGGMFVHRVANATGFNRQLARMRVPIRI